MSISDDEHDSELSDSEEETTETETDDEQEDEIDDEQEDEVDDEHDSELEVGDDHEADDELEANIEHYSELEVGDDHEADDEQEEKSSRSKKQPTKSKEKQEKKTKSIKTKKTTTKKKELPEVQFKDDVKFSIKQTYQPIFLKSPTDTIAKKKDILYPTFYEMYIKVNDNFWKTIFINFSIGKFQTGFGYNVKNNKSGDLSHCIIYRKGKKIIKKQLSNYINQCIYETQTFIVSNTSMMIPKEALYFVKQQEKKDNSQQQSRQQNKKLRLADFINSTIEEYHLTKQEETSFRKLIAKHHLTGNITSAKIVYDDDNNITWIKGLHYDEDNREFYFDTSIKSKKKATTKTNDGSLLSPVFQRDRSEASSSNIANKNWKKYLDSISKNAKYVKQ